MSLFGSIYEQDPTGLNRKLGANASPQRSLDKKVEWVARSIGEYQGQEFVESAIAVLKGQTSASFFQHVTQGTKEGSIKVFSPSNNKGVELLSGAWFDIMRNIVSAKAKTSKYGADFIPRLLQLSFEVFKSDLPQNLGSNAAELVYDVTNFPKNSTSAERKKITSKLREFEASVAGAKSDARKRGLIAAIRAMNGSLYLSAERHQKIYDATIAAENPRVTLEDLEDIMDTLKRSGLTKFDLPRTDKLVHSIYSPMSRDGDIINDRTGCGMFAAASDVPRLALTSPTGDKRDGKQTRQRVVREKGERRTLVDSPKCDKTGPKRTQQALTLKGKDGKEDRDGWLVTSPNSPYYGQTRKEALANIKRYNPRAGEVFTAPRSNMYADSGFWDKENKKYVKKNILVRTRTRSPSEVRPDRVQLNVPGALPGMEYEGARNPSAKRGFSALVPPPQALLGGSTPRM